MSVAQMVLGLVFEESFWAVMFAFHAHTHVIDMYKRHLFELYEHLLLAANVRNYCWACEALTKKK